MLKHDTSPEPLQGGCGAVKAPTLTGVLTRHVKLPRVAKNGNGGHPRAGHLQLGEVRTPEY